MKDLVGQRYGRLTVLERSPLSTPRKGKWLCRCDCGVETHCRSDALYSGATKSCGCLQREKAAEKCVASGTHGGKHSALYRIWCHMKARCECKTDASYYRYGGRGITVCERWHGFANFRDDMGSPPLGMTLDRRDNSLGYSPENCRWATATQQVRNRRTSIYIKTADGLLPTAEWAKYAGISYDAARARVQRKQVEFVRPFAEAV